MYDQLDSYIELAENTGRISANNYRLKQIDEENKKLSKLNSEYDNLKTTMENALASGKITIESEGYYEMLGVLNEIQENIASTVANIAELNKSIRETNWEIFDKAAETISNMNDELEFLYGLLGDEDDMFDEKGIVNNSGIAGFGILSYESQRKAIDGANDYKDSIIDLVESGIKKQIDSLKDLISNYTDLMDAQKDEIDYAKKVADAQNNVNKIQKQLNAYANDDTEEGASRRQKLRNDLKNAQESLAQTEEERRISQTKKLLSDLQDEYEDILNARLDDIDALIQAVINGVDANGSIIATAINEAASDVGYTLTDEMGTVFSGVSDLASYFTGGDFINKVTSIASAVENIETYFGEAIANANKNSNSLINSARGTVNSNDEAFSNASVSGTKATNLSNKVSGVDGFWNLDSKGYRKSYTMSNGTKATGWSKIDNKWFYFDSQGNLSKGLQTISGSKYYVTGNKGRATSEWVQVNKKWYYFGANGKALTGWQHLTKDGKKGWYFFNPSNNQLVTSSWIQGNKITNTPTKGAYYVDATGFKVENGKFKTKNGYRTFDKY